MADMNILAALDAELDGNYMLVLLPRPAKHGRRLDWEDIEYRPELVTLMASTFSHDPGILKITATYKVPENGKLVERTARWWVSASSIGLEVLAAGGRYARISVKEIRECGTYRSMSDGQEWRNIAALARLVVFHCRSLWDFR